MHPHQVVTRGLAKAFIPTCTKSTPTSGPSNGVRNVTLPHALSRHSTRTPPPAPRLRTVPLPSLEPSINEAARDRLVHPPRAQNADIALNSLLAYGKAPQLIAYDVSTPPSSSRLPSLRLLEPAMHPTSTRMHITCDGFPWPIEVSVLPGNPLSCLTVLCGIFVSLQRTVSNLEWEVTPPTMQKVAWDAFVRRCQAQMPSSAPKQRVKRLDFLSGRTLFNGLSPLDGSGKWVLHLGDR